MIKKPMTIQISNGLEARPVAMLVQVASQYESKIQVENGDRRVNAKSIMGMMTLGLNVGESVTISAEGADEEAAIAGIEKYLTNKEDDSWSGCKIRSIINKWMKKELRVSALFSFLPVTEYSGITGHDPEDQKKV